MQRTQTITLTRLLSQGGAIKPFPGSTPGICYLCGLATEEGYGEKPSGNFTAWAQCYHGTVLCPECYAALKTPALRRSSWIAIPEQIIYLRDIDEPRALLRQVFIEPPDRPYAIYLTRGGQKQGWLSLLRYVNQGAQHFWVGVDWRDRPILLSPEYAVWALGLLGQLRPKISKAKLWGEEEYGVADYAYASEAGLLDVLECAVKQRGDPRWEVMIYAAD